VVHPDDAHGGVFFFVLEALAVDVVAVGAVEVGRDDVGGEGGEGPFEVDDGALGAVVVELAEKTADTFMNEGLESGDGLSGEIRVQDGAADAVSVVVNGR